MVEAIRIVERIVHDIMMFGWSQSLNQHLRIQTREKPADRQF